LIPGAAACILMWRYSRDAMTAKGEKSPQRPSPQKLAFVFTAIAKLASSHGFVFYRRKNNVESGFCICQFHSIVGIG